MSEHATSAWKELPFGGLCARIVNGGTPATDNARFWGGHIPWVTGADFTSKGIGQIRRYVTDAGLLSSATSVVKAGNLLVVTRTGVGKLAIAPFDIAISQDITGVYLDETQVDSRFAFHLLSREIEELKKLNQGTSINGIVRSDLERHKVSLPADTGQQRRIAAVLSRVDSAIEASEALIEKHQQIKAGLMHDLFTGGTPFNGHLRQHFADAPELFQETALGPLPLDWRRSTVGESFEIDSGITLGPHRRPARWPRKYLRVANVHRDQLRLDDVASIETLPGDDGYALEEGDLLVVEGHANPAEIGRCAMVDQDAAGMLFQNHLFRLRPNGIDKNFALLWLNSFHVQRYWERTCSTSSGLHTINRRMLRAVPMFVPSESEQTRIVSAAASARAVLDGHIKALAKLRAQKLGLMQDLLTGKVRVPLPKPEVTA